MKDFLIKYDHIVSIVDAFAISMPMLSNKQIFSTNCMILYQNHAKLFLIDMMTFYESYDSQREISTIVKTLKKTTSIIIMIISEIYYA